MSINPIQLLSLISNNRLQDRKMDMEEEYQDEMSRYRQRQMAQEEQRLDMERTRLDNSTNLMRAQTNQLTQLTDERDKAASFLSDANAFRSGMNAFVGSNGGYRTLDELSSDPRMLTEAVRVGKNIAPEVFQFGDRKIIDITPTETGDFSARLIDSKGNQTVENFTRQQANDALQLTYARADEMGYGSDMFENIYQQLNKRVDNYNNVLSAMGATNGVQESTSPSNNAPNLPANQQGPYEPSTAKQAATVASGVADLAGAYLPYATDKSREILMGTGGALIDGLADFYPGRTEWEERVGEGGLKQRVRDMADRSDKQREGIIARGKEKISNPTEYIKKLKQDPREGVHEIASSDFKPDEKDKQKADQATEKVLAGKKLNSTELFRTIRTKVAAGEWSMGQAENFARTGDPNLAATEGETVDQLKLRKAELDNINKQLELVNQQIANTTDAAKLQDLRNQQFMSMGEFTAKTSPYWSDSTEEERQVISAQYANKFARSQDLLDSMGVDYDLRTQLGGAPAAMFRTHEIIEQSNDRWLDWNDLVANDVMIGAAAYVSAASNDAMVEVLDHVEDLAKDKNTDISILMAEYIKAAQQKPGLKIEDYFGVDL